MNDIGGGAGGLEKGVKEVINGHVHKPKPSGAMCRMIRMRDVLSLH